LLEFSVVEKLPKRTAIYQVEDGTTFHLDCSHGSRLYVKWQDREIDAKLPSTALFNMCTLGNALFFQTKDEKFQIYKAEFAPARTIEVCYLRGKLEDEQFLAGGLCTIVREGKKYAYQLSDNPDTESLLIDSSFKGLRLVGVHR
ncbi:hypothetical protein PMAYCL1PPCAC_22235, partial [Pristionchus mayeri]